MTLYSYFFSAYTAYPMSKAPQDRYIHKPFIGSSHWWAERHFTHLSPDCTVLDIGPGSGAMGLCLKNMGLSELYAVEKDSEARAHATTIYKQAEEELSAISKTDFDLILLMDVLEHMPAPDDFFAEVIKLLKPGAKLLLSVPNIAHWSVRLPLLFGYFSYSERGILDRTHLQFFTKSRIKSLINDRELEIVEFSTSIEPAEIVLPQFLTSNFIFRALSHIRLFIAKALPGLMAYQHLLVIRKKA